MDQHSRVAEQDKAHCSVSLGMMSASSAIRGKVSLRPSPNCSSCGKGSHFVLDQIQASELGDQVRN